jgi:D-alanyl-D-alanine dipeptidase
MSRISHLPAAATVTTVATVTTMLLLAGCTIEDRTPGRGNASAPSAPAAANAPDGPLLGTAADADSLLVDVQQLDSTIIVDLRYRDSLNFTGAPLPGYEANRALLHRNAAAALARVQASLRDEGLSLKVWDAYRPVRATEAMVDWAQREGREALITDGYIADRSRHNLGVAIDCTLVELVTGDELDMGTPFDTFSEAAHTATASGRVAEHRLRFVTAMAREGFVNYDREWWHYSYVVPTPLRFDVPIRGARP